MIDIVPGLRVEAEVKVDYTNSYGCIFLGRYWGGDARYYLLHVMNNSSTIWIYFKNWTTPSFDIRNQWAKISLSEQKARIERENGGVLDIVPNNPEYISTLKYGTLEFCGIDRGVGVNCNMFCRYFRIYDKDDNLLCDAVPVYTPDGQYALYDLQRNIVLEKTTSSAVITGYVYIDERQPYFSIPNKLFSVGLKKSFSKVKFVEYLESTGTQYIDTGIPINGLRVQVTAQGTSNKDDNHLFGVIFGLSYFVTYWRKSWSWGNGKDIRDYYISNVSPFDKNTFDLGYSSDYFLVNGDKVSTENIVDTTRNDNLLICARYNNGSTFQGGGQWKIYNFKVRRGDEILLDLYPALDENGKPCMYNIIDEKCYYNSGTGEFSYKV